MKSNSAKIVVVLKYLFWIWLVIIFAVSSIPEFSPREFTTIGSTIRVDYILHLMEYFILISLLLFWKAGKNYRIKPAFVLLACIGIILFASLDEYHQVWIPGRSFNIKDMYFNYAGIVAGLTFTLFTLSRLRSKGEITL